tara:strand:- start:2923 stop:3087 length:165 start_codon:yes stop_codon:yes gene_type:complete
MDGVDVCARMKESAEIKVPVLMLTAQDSFEDKPFKSSILKTITDVGYKLDIPGV